MKQKILVLAGTAEQAKRFMRDVMRNGGDETDFAYITSKSLNYLGLRDCKYVKVGTWYDAGYTDEMWRYFETHGITEAKEGEPLA